MSQKLLVNLNKNTEMFSDKIVCEKCGDSIDKLEYDRHLKLHKEKRVETCNICFKTFTNLSNFKYHMSHHSEERPWHCDECPKCYKTKIDLLQHKRIHERAKDPYFCEICSEQFSIRSKYNSHLKTVHSVRGPQKCEICNKTFVNLRSHIQTVHEKVKNYKCTICEKAFGKKSGLARHVMTVHEKMKIWACDICEKSFGEKAQLLRHQKTHLNDKSNNKINDINAKYSIILEEVTDEYASTNENSINSDILEEVYIIPEPQENETIEESNLVLKIEKLEEAEAVKIEVLDEYRDSLSEVMFDGFKCDICCITFKEKRYYQSHLRTIHGNVKQLECKFCSEKFTHRTQRLRHVRLKHSEIYEENASEIASNKEELSSRSCKLCDKIFKKPNYLLHHLATVHNQELFQCDFCQRKFSFKRSMERHIKAIHENKRDFKCPEMNCEKAFRSRYELNEHFKNIHDQIKRSEIREEAICDICEKILSSKKALYSHKKLVHEGVKWGLNYECKFCFEKFDSKYKKIKHLNQVHRNGEIRLRTCQLCSSQFQFYNDFKAHIESHQNCFICIICGYNFQDKSSLFIHQETHKKIEEELRQFICDICSHRLTTKSQLEIHMRKHSSENHYVCDECGKSYKFLSPFLYHKLVHTNKFDYSCSFCSKHFRKMRDKVMHEKTHSGVRPYKCNFCEKDFALKPNYLNHMKTHQSKFLECKICHVHQSSSSKLRQHEIIEHPEEFLFKCINCSKYFKASHTYEEHRKRCIDELNFVN